jgi:hypothetical protein
MKKARRALSAIADDLRLALKRETANIIKIGVLLVEAKDAAGHGNFLPWLKREFSMSERSAQNYMRASRFAAEWSKSATIADLLLSPSALYLLSGRKSGFLRGIFTPNAIAAVLKEAESRYVDDARCIAIAEAVTIHERQAAWAEERATWAEERAAEREAEEAEAEEVLDGPPGVRHGRPRVSAVVLNCDSPTLPSGQDGRSRLAVDRPKSAAAS